MARSFPDGSKATRAFPDPPAAAADTSKWEVLYEADIGDVSADSAAINDGVAVTINGKDWTARNAANTSYCSGFQVIKGSGLHITIASSDADSEQDGSTTNVPLIEISIATLIGETPASDDTLAFQVLMESTGMNDNWQTQGITIIDGANKWVANRTLYNGGADGYSSGPVGNDVMKGDGQRLASLANYGTGSNEPGLRETVWHVGSASFICSSNINKAFVAPLTSTSMEVCTTVDSASGVTNITENPTLAISRTGAKVQLIAGHENNDDGSTWTAKYTHFRVLRRKKS